MHAASLQEGSQSRARLYALVLFAGVTAASQLGPAPSLQGCGPGPSLPDSDTCRDPETAVVESIELVASGTAVASGQAVPVIMGGQGSDMLVLQFRLTGTTLPECAAQTATLDQCVNSDCSDRRQLGINTVAVRTYPNATGRQTGDVLLILGFAPAGTPVELSVEIGGLTETWRLWIETMPDAGPDAALAE